MRSEGYVQPRLSPIEPPPTVDVVSVPLALIDYRERGYVCVCNVHTVMAAGEDWQLRAALHSSSLNVPDGQPLVWALNALGHPIRNRVYGPELMSQACAEAARTGQRFYLYGGRNQGALVQLTLNLRQRYPGIKIVGGYSPPHRSLTTDEHDVVIDEINRSRADVVWVGIGVPKQEKWMAQMRPFLQSPVLVGVGAAFDFHAGLVPQAPPWMQSSGLEWVYRLAHEPRRLWRRYLRYNPRFLGAFAMQLTEQRRTQRKP
jgi:N-acetylglucosaminyldiphosphoundecaprenol N-acetyl-beta-D-mannosaminyltransferase